MFGRINRQVQRRDRSMRTAVVRDFSGGLNVADNDLNLSSNYASVLDNMTRQPDGSIGLRYGTKLFTDLGNKAAVTGDLPDNPLSTTIGSAVVTITWTAHGFLSGHSLTIDGLSGFDGIPAGELNGTHIVTRVDANNFTITVTTLATAGGTGGGGISGTYSYDNQNVTDDLIYTTGFRGKAIAVSKAGEIALVDAAGNSVIIWSEDIAQTVDSTAGWSSIAFASTTQIGRKLKIHNGTDKPVEVDIDAVVPCRYMQDPGSGSNTNTPVGRYAATVGDYHCVAGIASTPGGDDGATIVSISAKGAPNTFLGDPAPNDAIELNIANFVSTNSPIIRGIKEYRGQLLVFFDDVVVPVALGTYDTTDHVPTVGEPLDQHGSLSHHSIVSLGNDCLACDMIGVPSVQRGFLDQTFRPKRVSQLIDPLIQASLDGLSEGTLEDRVFSVYNVRLGQYMLFIPNNNVEGSTTETTCYVYTLIEELKVRAWARFTGWNFRCAGRSTLGRVLLGKGKRLFVYGAPEDEYYTDYINDPDIAVPADGVDIAFTWELPWADFDKRANLKHMMYIKFDTRGAGTFTFRVYGDNILVDNEAADAPLATMDFVGGDAGGFGEGDQPFGGGRNVADERLYEFPAKFMIAKLKISGTTNRKLQFVSLILYYLLGEIRR